MIGDQTWLWGQRVLRDLELLGAGAKDFVVPVNMLIEGFLVLEFPGAVCAFEQTQVEVVSLDVLFEVVAGAE